MNSSLFFYTHTPPPLPPSVPPISSGSGSAGRSELAFAHDGAFFRRSLVAASSSISSSSLSSICATETTCSFSATRKMVTPCVLRPSDPDVADGRADHLALVGDQHQLLARLAGKLATTGPLRSDVSMLVMPWPPRLVRRYS